MVTLALPGLSSSSSTFLFSHPTISFRHLYSLAKRPSFQLKKPLTVTSLQSPECDASVSAEVQTFWNWLRDEGVVSHKTLAKPGVVPEGLGLIAQRDIARNEVVLEVPKRLWINPDAVAASEIGNVCSGLKPWIAVALFLIREKFRDDSAWRLYLDILPEYTNSTIFWWVWLNLNNLYGFRLLVFGGFSVFVF